MNASIAASDPVLSLDRPICRRGSCSITFHIPVTVKDVCRWGFPVTGHEAQQNPVRLYRIPRQRSLLTRAWFLRQQRERERREGGRVQNGHVQQFKVAVTAHNPNPHQLPFFPPIFYGTKFLVSYIYIQSNPHNSVTTLYKPPHTLFKNIQHKYVNAKLIIIIYPNPEMAVLETLRTLKESTSFLDTSTIIALTVFFTLLCLCIIIGHLLEEHRWANESITALLLGLISGVVVLLVTRFESSQILVFSEDLFFLYLLPPIIFNAGFQVKKKQFFKNFTTILLFGIVGTAISFCLISTGAYLTFSRFGFTTFTIQDYLAIGAILSATDSVCTLQVLSQDDTPFLYSVVFGEGVVNDATSIVLFNAVQSLDMKNVNGLTALNLLGTFLYLFSTSTLLGIAAGLLSAYIIKTLYFGRHSTDREVALMMLMAYLSYMLAELLDLSGILTVFFCGIVMSHYTWHNVTESSRITTKHAFATMSFIAETFIFLYVGMDAMDIDKWKASKASAGTSIGISSVLLGLVLIGRAAFIFPIANISNCFKRRESAKIGFRQQFIMWWAGLMRGAVTIALSYNQFADATTSSSQDNARMITCTMIVVLFSTVVFGSITKPLIEAVLLRHATLHHNISDATDIPSLEDLRLLFLETGDPSEEGGNGDPSHEEGNGQPRVKKRSSLTLLMTHTTSTVHYFWRKFDDKFMRPVFGGRGFVPFVPGSPSGAIDQTAEQEEET